MNSNSWRPRERLADTSVLVEELRSLEWEAPSAGDGESVRDQMSDFRQRLLDIAEHLEAHEKSLFAQRDTLREQLLAVRVEIQRERKLLEAAQRFREQHSIPESSRIGYVAPGEDVTETAPSLDVASDAANTHPKDSLPRARKVLEKPVPISPTDHLPTGPSPSARPSARPSAGTQGHERTRTASRSLFTRAAVETSPATKVPAWDAEPELELAVRWWNLVPALALVLLLAFGVGWGSLDLLRAHLSKIEVAMEIEDPASNAEKIEKRLASRQESLLTRQDAERDYVVACALRRLQEFSGSDPMVHANQPESAVYQNLRRAVARAPANVWYRLTQARIADRLQLSQEERERVWRPVSDVACAEPLFREALADHYLQLGEKDWALTIYGTVLQGRPDRTGPVLARLAESGIKRGEYLDIVPDAPEPILETTRFLKSAGHADWWTFPQSAIDRLVDRLVDPSESELSAILSLCELINKQDRALQVLEVGLAKFSRRQDWQLRLAQLRYDRKDYDESGRLARAVLRAQPASDEAKLARLLIEKIELASSRPSSGGTRPLSN